MSCLKGLRMTARLAGSPLWNGMRTPTHTNTAIQCRTVVFVRGSRVRGLVRDPEEILQSNGIKYAQNDQTLSSVKSYLGDEYQLPDKLLLQAITHKSFAHGTKPYNEKLAFLGEELLRLGASKHALKKTPEYQFAVNDINFDSLGSLTQRLLVTDRLLSQYADQKGIDKVFFCRPSGDEKPKRMYSTILSSLVGAIALQHGKKAAEKFIEDRVIGDLVQMVGNL